MVEKLKQAGLGYHKKATHKDVETFSRIPLRELVYRVHPLPLSMVNLVWDFGDLTDDVTKLYIRQMVDKFVS